MEKSNICYARGFGSYVFLFLMGGYLGFIICIRLCIENLEDIEYAELFGIVCIVGIIYVILKMKNFKVYVETDKIVYINWIGKKTEYTMNEFKKFKADGVSIVIVFNNGSISLCSWYKNYKVVKNEIAVLYMSTRDVSYVN